VRKHACAGILPQLLLSAMHPTCSEDLVPANSGYTKHTNLLLLHDNVPMQVLNGFAVNTLCRAGFRQLWQTYRTSQKCGFPSEYLSYSDLRMREWIWDPTMPPWLLQQPKGTCESHPITITEATCCSLAPAGGQSCSNFSRCPARYYDCIATATMRQCGTYQTAQLVALLLLLEALASVGY
jgi:hypothetical protein